MEEKMNELLDVMDNRDLDVFVLFSICVTETKCNTTNLLGNRVALWGGVSDSEQGYDIVGVLLSSLG